MNQEGCWGRWWSWCFLVGGGRVKCVISRVLWEVFSGQVFSRDPGWGGYRKKRTGGSSGYDHPSPSIPLPVEGRGKPMAMRPERLDVLAASVTDLQTVTCIMGFLRVSANHWDNDAWRRLAGWMPVIARPHSGFAGEVSKRKMCYFWGFL